MAHFARIDENNMVIDVLVVPDEQEHRGHEFLSEDLGFGGTWIQTSYNSFQNVHYDIETRLPSGKPALRKNYAGIGYYYDENLDAFIPPKPEGLDSFIVDSEIGWWVPPIPYPDDSAGPFEWDEPSVSWIASEPPYPSWSWSPLEKKWNAPVPCPGEEYNYKWDEESQTWNPLDEMI
jgi:hypothetical protein